MGLFSRNFERMQTEEERYAGRSASQPTQSTGATGSTSSRDQQWSTSHPIAGPARVRKLRSKVAKVGTIEKRGGKFVIDGWTFTEGTPEQVQTGTEQTRIGSLTVADLCDIYEYETGCKVRR
jgi:hypothetical protein